MHCLPEELLRRADAYDIAEVQAHFQLEYQDWKEKERERERQAKQKKSGGRVAW